jgi:hypothetical protein
MMGHIGHMGHIGYCALCALGWNEINCFCHTTFPLITGEGQNVMSAISAEKAREHKPCSVSEIPVHSPMVPCYHWPGVGR